MSSEATPAGLGNRIVARGFEGTWADLAPWDLPPAAAVGVRDHLEAVRVVREHVTSARESLIASAGRLTPDLQDDLRAAGLAVVRDGEVFDAVDARAAEAGRVWLLTSGSTGRPKRVAHTIESLTTVAGEQPRRTWLCPYAHGAYAWWQVVTLGLSMPGQDIVFVEPSELDSWPEQAVAAGVTAVSGTPTFWRQALFRSGETLAELRLEQVTLGGEPVDQAVLDQVRTAFPDARVSWIYASSEAGATIAVHDGLAGFPVEWLDQDKPGRARLSVEGDELVIGSDRRGAGVDARLRTGDRVEIVGGRVRIVGRLASDEINVGGSKASAAAVRDVLQAHPAVVWAAVKGRKAPLVGNIVAADVVLDSPVDETDLTAWCAARLPDYAVPRRFRVLDSVPLKETLKSDV